MTTPTQSIGASPRIDSAVPTNPVPANPAAVQISDTVVQSAPKAVGTPLTPEARRQRYDALRARMGHSILKVEPPAGMSAYWAYNGNTGEGKAELARLQFMGFEIVRELDPLRPVWKANGLQPDGTYVVGDVLLMGIETELYELHKEDAAMKGKRMQDGASEEVRNRLAEQGVPTFAVTKSTKG